MKKTFSQLRKEASLKAQHDEALEELYISSSIIIDRKDGLSLTVRALTTALEHYVTTEYQQIVRCTDEEDMDYFNAVITGVCDAIEFVARVSESHEVVDFFKREIRELEKQQSHEN